MKDKNFPNKTIQTQYTTWALARRGTRNPQDMTNPVWTWMMKEKVGPYKANQQLDKNHNHQPGWCYYRMGQTETALSDGTKILIAGEHEDSYDPDFFIYNDVTVIRPDGEITFYGYPEYHFAPTDNHSATLVEKHIYIIGCLGYPHQRHKDKTPVYKLSLDDFSIRKVLTEGETPNWLHNHNAKTSDDKKFIICDGGHTIHPSGNYLENLAEWQLELNTGTWTKLSEKQWTRWRIYRADNSRNELSDINQLQFDNRSSRRDSFSDEFRAKLQCRNHEIDFQLFESRHLPPVPHKEIGEDEENFRHFRVSVDGIIIRLVESSYDIFFNIEGDLSKDTVEILKAHYLETYARLEGVDYEIEIIE